MKLTSAETAPSRMPRSSITVPSKKPLSLVLLLYHHKIVFISTILQKLTSSWVWCIWVEDVAYETIFCKRPQLWKDIQLQAVQGQTCGVRCFHCLMKMLEVGPDKASTTILACVILHNLMRVRYPVMQRRAGDWLNNHGIIVKGTWWHRRQLICG